jgi:UDP:flavonoid glycosyltransferase YjiC (YdhE family)
VERIFLKWLADLKEAILLSKERAIIQVPEAFFKKTAAFSHKELFFLCHIEHQSIFPRCRAVIHHGGAGTTQTTLHCKLPAIIVPHITDQFYWAQEVYRLGVAPKPLHYLKFSPARLAERIKDLKENPRYALTARNLGEKISEENGVARAIQEIAAFRLN